MELKVLGSSSAGNCYILDDGKQALIIEAGVSFTEIKKALNFNISRIAGCIVSHEHVDHAHYINSFLKNQIPVYASKGTAVALNLIGKMHVVFDHEYFRVGDFQIVPFKVKHDAAEPFGYLIRHNDMGNLLFATDFVYLEYTFHNLNNIMIECNYSLEILDDNDVPQSQRDRVVQNHCSLKTCIETLQANDLKSVNNVVLLHLSDRNSNAASFINKVTKATGKNVYVADKGVAISHFNVTPF